MMVLSYPQHTREHGGTHLCLEEAVQSRPKCPYGIWMPVYLKRGQGQEGHLG
jgi:hypothetical protein